VEAKLLALKTSVEAVAEAIKGAHTAAYGALAKAEKLDKDLFFIEHKTQVLEKNYSRFFTLPPDKK